MKNKDVQSRSFPQAGRVALALSRPRYDATAPFSPGEAYPEYPFSDAWRGTQPNEAYRAVRKSLHLLGLDAQRHGSKGWNPLRGIVHPGDTVVLKPNFVRDFRESRPGHEDCMITHGSIIRAVADYVYLAMDGQGRIIIADAPQNDANFDNIRKMAGLDALRDLYGQEAGFEIEVLDLRPERTRKVRGVIVGHDSLPGDPLGYVRVNLGAHSAFAHVNHLCHLLYGSEYDTNELCQHHHDDVHEYLISKTILDADCVINLPKMKTHKKTGVTLSMKNLVGINGNKNWLPHYREGTPAEGGDQFADNGVIHRVERAVVSIFKQVFPRLGRLRPMLARPTIFMGRKLFGDTNEETIRSGNWHGNDTTWRMVMDLNRILIYSDSEGKMHTKPRRRSFIVVDGIVAGEGDGPLDPTPKPAGVVVAGIGPVAVDLVCTRLMGFDFRKIRFLIRAFDPSPYPLTAAGYDDVRCLAESLDRDCLLDSIVPITPPFNPCRGWKDAIELPYQKG